jgi:DNA polymerase III beta subunit
MRQKDLRDGLRKTAYAISTDETRYVLNGVLFSFKENKLTLVATDGRRLAMVDIELEFPRSHEADIIVPTKAVTELQRLLTDDGDVKISVGTGQIAFDLNNTLLVSKLIEGNYPNYKQVIPSEAKGACHARTRDLSQFAAAGYRCWRVTNRTRLSSVSARTTSRSRPTRLRWARPANRSR